MQRARIVWEPPPISRLPSNGMGLFSGAMCGSSMAVAQAASRTAFDGQVIHENTTVSSSLACPASTKEVSLPGGTSSPTAAHGRQAAGASPGENASASPFMQ